MKRSFIREILENRSTLQYSTSSGIQSLKGKIDG
jgi:hypothetical protein